MGGTTYASDRVFGGKRPISEMVLEKLRSAHPYVSDSPRYDRFGNKLPTVAEARPVLIQG